MGDEYKRHLKIWKPLHAVCRMAVRRKFDITAEEINIDGPMLLIPNHVTSWDPILVAMSFPDKQFYYVASEHLFRKGLLTRILKWLVGPIPRSKGTSGMDTVRTCLRHLKAGHSVCLFAEGEQSWDGRNIPVFPATGKLTRSSGATLVTYRLEGAYLCLPRWAENIRRGKIYGHPVGVYPPEVLKSMTSEEINDVINRDISENAWERQKKDPQEYTGANPACSLERLLYLCPKCKRVGTLKSEGDSVSCSCGLKIKYRADGFFDPSSPFSDISEWEDWQKNDLIAGDFEHGVELFSDDGIKLSEVGADHTETALGQGKLIQFPDHLQIGEYRFNLDHINDMAMTRTHILLFSSDGKYYQLIAGKGTNLRKYLEIYKSQIM